ncbi:MAG TPA: DsbE family thiol:disulfide interchange protein [Amaricoccus sp.]|uniref:DsbE family thiol:disulfide interchange protein n=1 Tax=Amaricoccus sp. TaxID=1872485 RepID=UPI002B8A379B|nr:DsbE family thiol:disulfide interchange protein [Amaricoccus sp.]HPG23625.1 DsbE family thiol:disulfide interchange protein [Amaricoccus sp.]HRW16494.1 DsbE family thiol:disulfide interchange protein [Amaricoccus sp.]
MARPSFNLLMLLPPLLFAVFAGLAWFALTRENPDELPSALIGRPAPSLAATTALRDDPAPTDADLRAPGVKLVNFWASWCGPCRAEHPMLEELAAEGQTIVGVNYKDDPANARAFLAELGDPFAAIGADRSGRTGLDWGIYGVPETFVIAPDGTILLRHPGPLTRDIVERRLRPAIADAE